VHIPPPKHEMYLPPGAREIIVQTIAKAPASVDSSSLSASMAVTRESATAAPSYSPAQYFSEHKGYGVLVDTDDIGAGSFLVRTKVTTGSEEILLGPNRLIVA